MAEVCGALGATAGVTVALSMPAGSAEADEAHLDVMAQAYRSALLEMLTAARDARRREADLAAQVGLRGVPITSRSRPAHVPIT